MTAKMGVGQLSWAQHQLQSAGYGCESFRLAGNTPRQVQNLGLGTCLTGELFFSPLLGYAYHL